MFRHIESILRQLSEVLKDRFPDRIVKVAVFGSRVRATHDESSDIDVLVVVRDKTPELERSIVELFVEVELASGLPLSPVIKDQKAFEKEKDHHSPFFNAIKEEALEI
jgi:predicted nucleotidyltransferase